MAAAHAAPSRQPHPTSMPAPARRPHRGRGAGRAARAPPEVQVRGAGDHGPETPPHVQAAGDQEVPRRGGAAAGAERARRGGAPSPWACQTASQVARRPWACRLCRLPLPPPPPPTGPPSTCPTVHPDPSRTHPADTLLQTVLDFALSDQVYARARVRGAASVNLWLGAGVMLEYDLPEAKQLLVRRGTAAQRAARAACGARCGWRCVPAPGSCLCRRPGLR
jgi:hypothetical protein